MALVDGFSNSQQVPGGDLTHLFDGTAVVEQALLQLNTPEQMLFACRATHDSPAGALVDDPPE